MLKLSNKTNRENQLNPYQNSVLCKVGRMYRASRLLALVFNDLKLTFVSDFPLNSNCLEM